jgi:hypothetical protein
MWNEDLTMISGVMLENLDFYNIPHIIQGDMHHNENNYLRNGR